MNLTEKFREIDWILFILVATLAVFGFAMLYSVAGGNLQPWAIRQMIRFVGAFILMVSIALIDIRIWYRLAWIFFFSSIILLLLVHFKGSVGMGAKRWIDFKFFTIQPSEIMKITSILVIARFYSGKTLRTISSVSNFAILGGILCVPTILVYSQPDLGTAILLVVGGLSIAFLAGVSWRWFLWGSVVFLSMLPIFWSMVLHPYQKRRIITFLNPESDPLGAGYHVMQSQLSIESGGLLGRGFMEFSHSILRFLPEKHTDFIFSVVSEELGFAGAIALLLLVLIILYKTMFIALHCKSKFAKLVVMGMGTTFFLYIFINVGMVMGIFPVVGIPFPLLSYGGTVMFTIMIAFGFIQNAWVHRDIENPNVDVE